MLHFQLPLFRYDPQTSASKLWHDALRQMIRAQVSGIILQDRKSSVSRLAHYIQILDASKTEADPSALSWYESAILPEGRATQFVEVAAYYWRESAEIANIGPLNYLPQGMDSVVLGSAHETDVAMYLARSPGFVCSENEHAYPPLTPRPDKKCVPGCIGTAP